MVKPAVVVDTNVALTANDISGDSPFPAECINNCRKSIESIKESGSIALDCGREILGEYEKKLDGKKQQGEGDKFLKWIYNNISSGRVIYRRITPKNDSYEEFPNDRALEKSFDPSDRKFVAVANGASGDKKLEILQATDSKWWGWKDSLVEAGIPVKFLCEQYIKEKHDKKIG